MSNSDWMRGNFKKTPGYVCPPGKKDFPNMSFHGPTVVKGYADGGVVKNGIKDFPDMSFHKPPAVKGYADGEMANGFFFNLLRGTTQAPVKVEDRVQERAVQKLKTQDLLENMPAAKSDTESSNAESVKSSPRSIAVSQPIKEYSAGKDSQTANTDPNNEFSKKFYDENKEAVDKLNLDRANNAKRNKELKDKQDQKDREKKEAEEQKKLKPVEQQDYSSVPVKGIDLTQTAAAAVPTGPAVAATPSRNLTTAVDSSPKSAPIKTVARKPIDTQTQKVIYDEASKKFVLKGPPPVESQEVETARLNVKN